IGRSLWVCSVTAAHAHGPRPECISRQAGFILRNSRPRIWMSSAANQDKFHSHTIEQGNAQEIHGPHPEEPFLKAHLLRLVDCCRGLLESFFRSRNSLLWLSGPLSLLRGISRLYESSGYARLPAWISFRRTPVWSVGGGADRSNWRAACHSRR